MDNYNYPMGADNKNAPWNEEENPIRRVAVTISLTLSKTVRVKVSDYTVTREVDDGGYHYSDIDYSTCDLKTAVEEQIDLPQNAYKYFDPEDIFDKQVIKNLKGWNVDDFEVVLD